jgi:hypothetical protein
VSDVQQFRVQMRMRIGRLAPETLREWAFRTLDVVLEDVRIIDADVGTTLATGDVEFEMQVRADSAQAAMQSAADAVADATQAVVSDAWSFIERVPPIDHAEVDRVPIPA